MWFTPGGSIKRYTSSDCLSVRSSYAFNLAYSKSESCRNFQFGGDSTTMDTNNCIQESKLISKDKKSNENVEKTFFAHTVSSRYIIC